jgi:hypothetical protein
MYYSLLAKIHEKKVVYDDYNIFLCSLFNKIKKEITCLTFQQELKLSS